LADARKATAFEVLVFLAQFDFKVYTEMGVVLISNCRVRRGITANKSQLARD